MAGGRFKELLKKYGKVAFGVHCSVSTVSVSGLYIAIKNNVDIEPFLHKLHLPGLSPPHSHIDQDMTQLEQQQQQLHSSNAEWEAGEKNKNNKVFASTGGAFALAVLCNKALFPIRVPITIALTPAAARFLAKRRLIKPGV